jgi:hypothetical protein
MAFLLSIDINQPDDRAVDFFSSCPIRSHSQELLAIKRFLRGARIYTDTRIRRSSDCLATDFVGMLPAMSMLPTVQLADGDKLEVLRRLDQFRHWSSLDDKRYCLGCGKLVTGRQIQVIGGTRGNGPLRLICATERCPAIPMDWVLPNDEMLANHAPAPSELNAAPAPPHSRTRKNRIAASLRKFATGFRWVA